MATRLQTSSADKTKGGRLRFNITVDRETRRMWIALAKREKRNASSTVEAVICREYQRATGEL